MADRTAAVDAAPAPKSRGKLMLLFAAPLLVAFGSAGGWWFFGRGEGNAIETREPAPKPPVFVPMEAFTVNLAPENGQQQYAQIGINLKVAGAETAEAIKDRLPEIRNGILLLISSRHASELIMLNGKQKLADDIRSATMAVIAPGPAAAVRATRRPVAVAQVPTATQTDASGTAEPDPQSAEQTEDATPAQPRNPARQENSGLAVIEVLFTSFIIQ